MNKWIDINEFATKYGISQSTLRRRIRAKTIEFKLIKGKYFLEDAEDTLDKAPLFSRGKNPKVVKKAPSISSRPKESNNKVIRQSIDNEKLLKENLLLKKQLAEMETFINALEAEILALQGDEANL